MRKLITLALALTVVIGLTGLVATLAHGPPGFGPSGVYATPVDYQPISITMATPSAIPAWAELTENVGHMPPLSADARFSRDSQEVAPIAQNRARSTHGPLLPCPAASA